MIPSNTIKFIFDFFLALFLFMMLVIPLILITMIVRFTSSGDVIYWSKRVGKNNNLFLMPKFRTMKEDTPQVATHLLTDSNHYLTPIGKFLRKTSLDELPQLYSVLRGDMSFVGPRPALFNQNDLIALRTTKGVDKLVPGITGWAQINGRDDILIIKKVNLDYFYLQNRSIFFDIKIIILTIFQVIKSKNISH